MDAAPDQPLQSTLPIPEPGNLVRLERGAMNLTVERSPGGLRLEVDDGLALLRHFVGLPGTGKLELHAGVPTETLLVRMRDAIAIAPSARLHGYITVPGLQRLVLRRNDGGLESLLTFSPGSLRVLWAGARHGFTHTVPSRFDLWLERGAPGIAVPVHLRNLGTKTWRPHEFTLTLSDAELRQVRGRLCVAPRRFCHDDSGSPSIEVRPWIRTGAAA